MTRAIAHRIGSAFVLAAALAGCSVDSDVSRTLGGRCDSARQCEDRCLSPGATFPGGFCSVSCEAGGDCPSRASCADTEGGVCLFDCAADAECTFLGPGWRCLDVPRRGDATQTVKVCIGG
jgi:hypothetical protein